MLGKLRLGFDLCVLLICRVQSKLEKAGIQWDLHLFADTVNTDAADIAQIIKNRSLMVQSAVVVLAHHD